MHTTGRMRWSACGLLAAWLRFANNAGAQQVADNDFKPTVGGAAYATGKGPVVLVDEAHFNFHTAGGRYQPFANLLRRDGYVVKPSPAKFSRSTLGAGRILVIANALGERNQTNWNPPIDPAFSADEIKALHDWVNEGGALLLIVDHFPFPVAANTLAAAFGVHFDSGTAVVDPARATPGPDMFSRQDGALADHAITRGRAPAERLDSIATFTGSAFKLDKGGEPTRPRVRRRACPARTSGRQAVRRTTRRVRLRSSHGIACRRIPAVISGARQRSHDRTFLSLGPCLLRVCRGVAGALRRSR